MLVLGFTDSKIYGLEINKGINISNSSILEMLNMKWITFENMYKFTTTSENNFEELFKQPKFNF